MEEYAAAVLRGENPTQAKPAAASGATDTAAATDEDAISDVAATDDVEDEGKTATESATEGDQVEFEEAHPAKKGINKRFSELTAEKKALQAAADEAKAATEAANQRAARAEAEFARLTAEAEKAQATVPVVVDAKDDPAPNRNEYDDPDEFTAAISAHATRQELRRASAAAQEAAAERARAAQTAANAANQEKINAAINELHGNFQKRVAEVKTEYPDYDEKVSNNTDLTMRNQTFFMIEQATDSPHILYHLASNPDVLSSLDKLNQMEAAIRIGEIQAELRIARKPKVTKSAPVVKPVGNRASPQQKTPNEESMEEYAARREQEEKASANKRTRII
jgi:hypothetical protein